MDKLPLVRVAEVAFLAFNVKECIDFYRKIGMVDLPTSPGRLNFASVGEQLYGVCDEKTGFFGSLDSWLFERLETSCRFRGSRCQTRRMYRVPQGQGDQGESEEQMGQLSQLSS